MTLRTLFNSLLLGSVLSPLAALAADVATTVPAAVQGTWQMTYFKSSNTTTYPAANGKVATIVISSTSLCIDGVEYKNPVIRNGNSVEGIWSGGGFEYAFSSFTTVNAENELNITDLGVNKWAGQYHGTRTSTSTTCAAVSTTPTVTANMQSVFDLAAELYPSMFVNGSALSTYQGYVYKFFASSGIYVAVKDDHVFLLGGPWSSITDQGAVSTVLGYLQTTKTNQAQAASGLYKLTLTGNLQATVAGFATSVPVNVTLNNVPAPAPTDTGLIVNQVQSSLGASNVANIKVVVVNNTASRVTFTVTFSATLAAYGNVTYNLTYDYTK